MIVYIKQDIREPHEYKWIELGKLGSTGKLEVQENRDHEVAQRAANTWEGEVEEKHVTSQHNGTRSLSDTKKDGRLTR